MLHKAEQTINQEIKVNQMMLNFNRRKSKNVLIKIEDSTFTKIRSNIKM